MKNTQTLKLILASLIISGCASSRLPQPLTMEEEIKNLSVIEQAYTNYLRQTGAPDIRNQEGGLPALNYQGPPLIKETSIFSQGNTQEVEPNPHPNSLEIKFRKKQQRKLTQENKPQQENPQNYEQIERNALQTLRNYLQNNPPSLPPKIFDPKPVRIPESKSPREIIHNLMQLEEYAKENQGFINYTTKK